MLADHAPPNDRLLASVVMSAAQLRANLKLEQRHRTLASNAVSAPLRAAGSASEPTASDEVVGDGASLEPAVFGLDTSYDGDEVGTGHDNAAADALQAQAEAEAEALLGGGPDAPVVISSSPPSLPPLPPPPLQQQQQRSRATPPQLAPLPSSTTAAAALLDASVVGNAGNTWSLVASSVSQPTQTPPPPSAPTSASPGRSEAHPVAALPTSPATEAAPAGAGRAALLSTPVRSPSPSRDPGQQRPPSPSVVATVRAAKAVARSAAEAAGVLGPRRMLSGAAAQGSEPQQHATPELTAAAVDVGTSLPATVHAQVPLKTVTGAPEKYSPGDGGSLPEESADDAHLLDLLLESAPPSSPPAPQTRDAYSRHGLGGGASHASERAQAPPENPSLPLPRPPARVPVAPSANLSTSQGPDANNTPGGKPATWAPSLSPLGGAAAVLLSPVVPLPAETAEAGTTRRSPTEAAVISVQSVAAAGTQGSIPRHASPRPASPAAALSVLQRPSVGAGDRAALCTTGSVVVAPSPPTSPVVLAATTAGIASEQPTHPPLLDSQSSTSLALSSSEHSSGSQGAAPAAAVPTAGATATASTATAAAAIPLGDSTRSHTTEPPRPRSNVPKLASPAGSPASSASGESIPTVLAPSHAAASSKEPELSPRSLPSPPALPAGSGRMADTTPASVLASRLLDHDIPIGVPNGKGGNHIGGGKGFGEELVGGGGEPPSAGVEQLAAERVLQQQGTASEPLPGVAVTDNADIDGANTVPASPFDGHPRSPTQSPTAPPPHSPSLPQPPGTTALPLPAAGAGASAPSLVSVLAGAEGAPTARMAAERAPASPMGTAPPMPPPLTHSAPRGVAEPAVAVGGGCQSTGRGRRAGRGGGKSRGAGRGSISVADSVHAAQSGSPSAGKTSSTASDLARKRRRQSPILSPVAAPESTSPRRRQPPRAAPSEPSLPPPPPPPPPSPPPPPTLVTSSARSPPPTAAASTLSETSAPAAAPVPSSPIPEPTADSGLASGGACPAAAPAIATPRTVDELHALLRTLDRRPLPILLHPPLPPGGLYAECACASCTARVMQILFQQLIPRGVAPAPLAPPPPTVSTAQAQAASPAFTTAAFTVPPPPPPPPPPPSPPRRMRHRHSPPLWSPPSSPSYDYDDVSFYDVLCASSCSDNSTPFSDDSPSSTALPTPARLPPSGPSPTHPTRAHAPHGVRSHHARTPSPPLRPSPEEDAVWPVASSSDASQHQHHHSADDHIAASTSTTETTGEDSDVGDDRSHSRRVKLDLHHRRHHHHHRRHLNVPRLYPQRFHIHRRHHRSPPRFDDSDSPAPHQRPRIEHSDTGDGGVVRVMDTSDSSNGPGASVARTRAFPKQHERQVKQVGTGDSSSPEAVAARHGNSTPA